MSVFEPRTVTVPIYGGDYHDRLDALEKKIRKAASEAAGLALTLDETPDNVALVEQYNALVAEAQEHRVDVVIKHLPRRVSKALRAQHPPRTAGVDGATEREAQGDALMGVNEETFREALIYGGQVTINGREVSYQSIVSPVLSSEDLDELSEGAFGKLYAEALELNYGFEVEDPKALSLRSPKIRENNETSS